MKEAAQHESNSGRGVSLNDGPCAAVSQEPTLVAARPRPQVKVCGLTLVDEAIACAEMGADAIGLVFYPSSPRLVGERTAREISMALPENIWKVGVFVDEPVRKILKRVEFCGLNCVQLHGAESPEVVESLELAGIRVIKSLFVKKRPFVSEAGMYRASAFLIESGEGPVPGGVGLRWKWGEAGEVSGRFPCILAGGLNPENVSEAIYQFGPDAVDVSSGVEYEPGRKDIGKVRAFIEAVRNAKLKFACLNLPFYRGKNRLTEAERIFK